MLRPIKSSLITGVGFFLSLALALFLPRSIKAGLPGEEVMPFVPAVTHVDEKKPTLSRSSLFRKEWDDLLFQKKETLKLRESDPEQFVVEYAKHLKTGEILGEKYSDLMLASSVLNNTLEGYIGLGHFVRFTLRRPAQALELYIKADELTGKARLLGVGSPNILLADLYQFDLKDKKKTVESYIRAGDLWREKFQSEKPDFSGKDWWIRGFDQEIIYLETGRRFSGKIYRAEVGLFFWNLMAIKSNLERQNLVLLDTGVKPDMDLMGGSPNTFKVERDLISKKLKKLPRSHFILGGTVDAMSYLSTPESILAYLENQDPTGYWSGYILAFALLLQETPLRGDVEKWGRILMPGLFEEGGSSREAFRQAAARFWEKTGIELEPIPAAASSTPANVWRAFVKALSRGATEDALEFISYDKRDHYAEVFKHLPVEKVGQDLSLTKFHCLEDKTMEHFVTCEIIRKNENGEAYSYPLSIIRDVDGVFRIYKF